MSLLQGTKAYGVHLGPFPVPARERWPRHPHENFYWLQEDYLRQRQVGKAWHWTVWRPQLILGESLGSQMNVIPALGVYAALRREAGLPLSFPGGPPFVFEAIAADLLARACEWATTTPASLNEIFNVTNGDVFVWQNVWPAIAAAFGMKVGPPEPCSLAEEMSKREAEWAAIVQKYQLRSPTSLREFVGQSFIRGNDRAHWPRQGAGWQVLLQGWSESRFETAARLVWQNVSSSLPVREPLVAPSHRGHQAPYG